MIAHYFSNLAVPMTITAGMDASQTTMQLNSLTGLPSSYPYFLVIDRDTADIEMVEVTSLSSGTTVNVVRGYGDTNGVAHISGRPVLHVAPAEFFTDTLADLTTQASQIASLGVDAGLKVKKLAARNATVSIANTETRVVGVTMLTGTLVTGTVIEFEAMGNQTNTTTASTSTWRIRIGPTTLTGAVVGAWTSVLGITARTNVPFVVMGKVTILSSTTAIATLSVRTDGLAYAAPSATITAAVTIATNANQEVELTVISGAASTTWNVLTAYQELVAA